MYLGVVSGGPVLTKYACTRHCIVLTLFYTILSEADLTELYNDVLG